jgi:SH3-like domain-containing protein
LRTALQRRLLFGVAALGAAAAITATAFAAHRISEVKDRSEAIIMQPKVDVLGEPRKGSTTLFVLHEGTKVTVLQEQNGWYEVKLGNGSVGWAGPEALVII